MSLFLLQGCRPRSDHLFCMGLSRARVAVLLLLPLLLFAAAASRAAVQAPSAEDLALWQKISSLDTSGKSAEALKELQAQQPPPENPDYYYNLGTLELKLGQVGYALAYLEKANHLKPHDPTIQHNLQIARASVGNAIGINRLDSASTWSEEIADRVTMEEVRGALGLVGSILVLMWLRSYLRTRRLRHTFLHPSAVLASVAFAITIGIYAAERLAEERPPAVVVSRQTVRSGPGDHYIELAEVEPGIKLRVLGPTAVGAPVSSPPAGGASSAASGSNGAPPAAASGEIWRQVRYSQDGIGWVPASSLLLL